MKYFVLVACVVSSGMARPDGAGGHSHAHHDHGAGHSAPAAVAAPSSGYQEPSSGYADPGSGYESPSGYAAPSGGGDYQAAGSGYETSGYGGGVSSGYGGSGYAVQEEPAFNPSMLIIPILIIAGIALLFPSVTTVPVNGNAQGRKKRDADDEVSGNSVMSRVQDIFQSVVQSEECLERIACEMGGLVADAGMSKDYFSSAAAFVPKKYTKMIKQFNNAKSCHKIKCGSF